MTAPSATAQTALADYLAAIVAGDRHRAMAAVESARAAGLGLRETYLEVLQPAQREVGRLWSAGTVTVAQEHLATAITQSVMSHLASDVFAAAPGNGPSLVAACVGPERHELGLRMLSDLLELEGWTTTYLGATVPGSDLVRMVESRAPAVVALSVTLPPHLLALRDVVDRLRAGPRPPLVMVGGSAFLGGDTDLPKKIGADLTASDAGGAVDLLKQRVA